MNLFFYAQIQTIKSLCAPVYSKKQAACPGKRTTFIYIESCTNLSIIKDRVMRYTLQLPKLTSKDVMFALG